MRSKKSHRGPVRYQAIRLLLMNYPTIHIRQLEGALGFTRQAYYQYWKRQAGQQADETVVLGLIQQIRNDHPRIGGRKLYSLLKQQLLERE